MDSKGGGGGGGGRHAPVGDHTAPPLQQIGCFCRLSQERRGKNRLSAQMASKYSDSQTRQRKASCTVPLLPLLLLLLMFCYYYNYFVIIFTSANGDVRSCFHPCLC